MIRTILSFPDPILKRKSAPVTVINDEVRQIAADMAETMYHAPGIGLAAPQIGLNMRLIVIDIAPGDSPSELITAINPLIIHADGEAYEEEGCLSVPNFSANVRRHEKIVVKGLDLEGKEQIWRAEGLLSIAFQHEIDHLDGILFIDRLTPLKREMYMKKLKRRSAE
jgi:peptide deformylase